MTNLNKIINETKVLVHKERYAYLKSKEKNIKNHFLICQDKDEITIITEEKNIINTKFEKSVKWFKLFEFKVSKPFLATGFLAKITKTIADKKINILIISTFSKDYCLIKEKDYKIALQTFKNEGFTIKT
jgi:uncharacterized protein